jgi:acyl CoA:acetate/3-ketoacid CoA transferase beta subunit
MSSSASTEVRRADVSSEPVTASEIMVTAASKEVHDGEVAVVGIGLPQVACVLARRTHAPGLSLLLEIGVANMEPVDTPVGLADSRIFYRATSWSGFIDTLGMSLHRGIVDVGFIGALEVDQHGNVNTTLTKDPDGRVRYFNGSAGGNDVASLAKRVIVIVRHGKRKLPAAVAHLTSPGFVNGHSRQELSLRGGGPRRVITDMAVLGFDNPSRTASVVSIHPGVQLEELLDNTGFPLHVPDPLPVTPGPTEEQLKLLRDEIDPGRVYLR